MDGTDLPPDAEWHSVGHHGSADVMLTKPETHLRAIHAAVCGHDQ